MWSLKGEYWSLNKVKLRHQIDNVPRWNLSLQPQITCQVIQGLIVAILELCEKGICHRFLDYQKNILLKFGNEQFIDPQGIEMIHVSFVHNILDDNVVIGWSNKFIQQSDKI